MSISKPCSPTLLAKPAASSEQFISQLEFDAPIVKASAWLHKLIIHKIRDVQAVAGWYRGECPERPEHPISELFDQKDARLCQRLEYYVHSVLKYKQGEVPASYLAIDKRCALILLEELGKLLSNSETLRVIARRVNDFYLVATAVGGSRMGRSEYEQKVESLKESIITLFGRVSDEFYHVEQLRLGRTSDPATTEDVRSLETAVRQHNREIRTKADVLLAVTGNTAAVVKRIDNREKRCGKRAKYSIELQEAVHSLWESAKANPKVRENGTGKIRYAYAFAYYGKELRALGIADEKDLGKCLKVRSNRFSRLAQINSNAKENNPHG